MKDFINDKLTNDVVKSIYPYSEKSIQELLSKFYSEIKHTTEISNQALKFLEWLVEKGVSDEVVKVLEEMYNDGRLEQLVNINKYNELDNKISSYISSVKSSHYVDYYMFGAIGNGIVDDTEAIFNTHIWANENGVDVHNVKGVFKLDSEKVIPIKTNSYLYGTKFIINEAKNIYFEIKSNKEPITLDPNNYKNVFIKNRNSIQTLKDYANSFLIVEDANIRVGRRYATTQDFALQDQLIIGNGGTVVGDIIHDINNPSNISVYPFDDNNIVFKGANFELICEGNVTQEYGYGGLLITRSNVTIDDVTMIPTHNLLSSSGSVYFRRCANITFNNCNFVPRQPKEPDMGTYGIGGDRCLNIAFNNCLGTSTTLAGGTVNYWGVMGTNLIKNLLIENSKFNRVDCHFQAHNITILNSEIGNRGITLCGSGNLIVKNTKITCTELLALRTDYGARWDGNIYYENIDWVPYTDSTISVVRIVPGGDGSHDYGYDLMLGSETVSFENIKFYQLWNSVEKTPLIKTFESDVFNGPYYLANNIIFKDIVSVNRKNVKGFVISNNIQLYKLLNKTQHEFIDNKNTKTNCNIVIDNVTLHDFVSSNPYSITGMDSVGHFIIDRSPANIGYTSPNQLAPNILFKNLKGIMSKPRGIRGIINYENCEIIMNDSYGYKLHETNQINNYTTINNSVFKPVLGSEAYIGEANRYFLLMNGIIKNTVLYPMFTNEYKNEFSCYKYFIDTIKKKIGENDLSVLDIETIGVTLMYYDLEELNLINTNFLDILRNNNRKSYDKLYGDVSERPVINMYVSKSYFDISINKIIYWTGSNWVDSMGTIV